MRTPRGLVEDEGNDMRVSSTEFAMESGEVAMESAAVGVESGEEVTRSGSDGCDEDAMEAGEEEDEQKG